MSSSRDMRALARRSRRAVTTTLVVLIALTVWLSGPDNPIQAQTSDLEIDPQFILLSEGGK